MTRPQNERYLPDDTPDIVSWLLEKTSGRAGIFLLALLFALLGVYIGLLVADLLVALYWIAAILLLLFRSRTGWILCVSTSGVLCVFSFICIPLMGGVKAMTMFTASGIVLLQAARRSVRAESGISLRSAKFAILFPVFLALAGTALFLPVLMFHLIH